MNKNNAVLALAVLAVTFSGCGEINKILNGDGNGDNAVQQTPRERVRANVRGASDNLIAEVILGLDADYDVMQDQTIPMRSEEENQASKDLAAARAAEQTAIESGIASLIADKKAKREAAETVAMAALDRLNNANNVRDAIVAESDKLGEVQNGREVLAAAEKVLKDAASSPQSVIDALRENRNEKAKALEETYKAYDALKKVN